MSLINDMLKDLDSRERNRSRSVQVGQYSYESESRTKPKAWFNTSILLHPVVTFLIAGALIWWVMHQQEHTTARTPLPVKAMAEAAEVSAAPAAAPPVAPSAPIEAPVIEERALPSVVATPKPSPKPLPIEKKPAAIVRAPAPIEIPVPVPVAATIIAKPSVTPAQARESLATKAEQIYQQALLEQKQATPDAAIKSLRASLEIYPLHTKSRLELARMMVEGKQSSAASDLLGDGLMLLPQQTGFMLAIAPLWIQAGQQNDAMTLLAQGAKSANNDPTYHAYYASQLLRLKRPAEAITHYRIALRGEPGKSEWLLGLGLSLHAAGNIREAVDTFRSAIESGGLSAQNKSMVEQVIVKLQTPAK